MFPLTVIFRKYRLALLALSMAGHALAGSEPPIHDSIRLSAAVMVQGQSDALPSFSGEWCKVTSKKLPSSISIYLKPSNVIDSHSPVVQKAARQVLKLLGPQATKQTLEDPRLLAEAVRAWVDMNFSPPDEDYEPRPYATDLRTLLPKASRLIKISQADAPGRVRVRLALLRALGVPARACWLRGEPAVQYWAQWIKDGDEPKSSKSNSKNKKKSAGPPKVKGEWVLDETAFAGETPEAWSMDAGDLAPALWLPEQELAYTADLERAYFNLSETSIAMATLDYVSRNGHLPLSVTARVLPPRKGTWLLIANHRTRFYTEGSMEALNPMELLLPYRPRLASWGSQQRPAPESLETLATAFWTDRPDRARIKKDGQWSDDYKSPPPAYGMLHYASIGLRKPSSVLDAKRIGSQITGKLLRRDSLAPRAGWDVTLTFDDAKASQSKLLKTDSQGNFQVDLDAQELQSPWIKVAGGQGSIDVARWDSILLEGQP
jgi:hypothetical protein